MSGMYAAVRHGVLFEFGRKHWTRLERKFVAKWSERERIIAVFTVIDVIF
jgi:hypothetical protein